MKILDRYVAKHFLIGYAISFCVLIGLWVTIDLFVNLDEFAEYADLGTRAMLKNVVLYYGRNITLYFRDIAGTITVVAAAFSLGKMVRNHEFVAMMASGVSLKRVVGPVLVLSTLFTGLLVVDQELLIPSLSDQLMRRKNTLPGQEWYSVWFIPDSHGHLICSHQFNVATATLQSPTILLREKTEHPGIWEVTGVISARQAAYNQHTGLWDLLDGTVSQAGALEGPQPLATYDSGDLGPKDIPIRQSVGYESLLSSRQLAALAAQNTKIKDVAQLYSQKHFRITDPILNLTMLLISLPVLICRDPRMMKSAVLLSFSLTAACSITTFACKMLSTETVFLGRIMPEFWAWLPVFIFVPIAFIELDAMKT